MKNTSNLLSLPTNQPGQDEAFVFDVRQCRDEISSDSFSEIDYSDADPDNPPQADNIGSINDSKSDDSLSSISDSGNTVSTTRKNIADIISDHNGK